MLLCAIWAYEKRQCLRGYAGAAFLSLTIWYMICVYSE